MGRTLLISLACTTTIAGFACSTPCGDLAAHAEDCGFAAGRYADDRDSVCQQLRHDLLVDNEPSAFDAFAACVVESECSDGEAIATCSEGEYPEAYADPCQRYRLWAAACGLEPLGTEDGCGDVEETAAAVPFADWVECITAGGCPLPDDDRYDECQDVVPPAMLDLLDACLIIEDWTTACAEVVTSGVPVTETSLVECFIQAQPFTAASYLEYAECLEPVSCDDTLARYTCFGNLDLGVLDPTQVTSQCQELLAYAAHCNNGLGGGSIEACTTMFARVTPESFGAYIVCLKSYPCNDVAAGYECGEYLEFI